MPHPAPPLTPDRIAVVIQSFTDAEKAEMVEPDGKIHVTCEYCSRVYAVAPDAFD